jgi:hypothetical protein
MVKRNPFIHRQVSMSAPHLKTGDGSRGKRESACVGIHLSGPNAKKSALVVLVNSQEGSQFLSLYEKIGSVGSLFSDERIIDILKLVPSLDAVFVDCPISEPPCVNCERPVCPGVVRCEDVAVGMMMAIEQKRGRKGGHKLRPLNPQNLRLWDAMYGRGGEFGKMEPTYSANLAPLVVRAKTLQRRLRMDLPQIDLRETHVPFLLKQLEVTFDRPGWSTNYRNFEAGFETRCEVLSEIAAKRTAKVMPKLNINLTEDAIDSVAASVESFHAFMAAAMAHWSQIGLARDRTPYFQENLGWVDLLNAEAAQINP